MCGIAGYMGEFEADELSSMSQLIRHRGPDGEGEFFASRNVGLAHRRLAIIDLAQTGRQPMTLRCPKCEQFCEGKKPVLLFNGEIYNFRDIKNSLIARDHTFFSKTDSEVLLHLYIEKGREFVRDLNGIFAFAIWDPRTEEIILARDSAGVKPLYFTSTSRGVAFSSEMKSFLALSDLDKTLDPASLEMYLSLLWNPAPRTPFKSVKKLLPGEIVVIKNSRVQWSRVFDDPAAPLPQDMSFEQAVEQIREEFSIAVERQMISDVPIGMFLSGGVDSSAIAGVMRKHRPEEKFSAYTIAFEGGRGVDDSVSDLPYAKTVAKELNLDLKVIEVSAKTFSELDKMLWALDEPQADPAVLNVLQIAKAAREDGVKVLMNGSGGDDLFSGYRRHLLTKMRAILGSRATKNLSYLSRISGLQNAFPRRIKKLIQTTEVGYPECYLSSFLWTHPMDAANLLANPFRFQPQKALLDSFESVVGDDLSRLLYVEQKHFLADHNLNYTDKASMAYGVETRVPILDLELIRLAARVPSRHKLKGFQTKAVFRESVKTFVPQEILNRPKSGFGMPLRKWLQEGLKSEVEETLYSAEFKNRKLFNFRAVEEFLQRDKEGRVDGAYSIFSLLCLERWCRLFVDAPTQRLAKGRLRETEL